MGPIKGGGTGRVRMAVSEGRWAFEFYIISMLSSGKSVSNKLIELKETIITKSGGPEASVNNELLNGSASHRLFERFAQLDQNLTVLLVLQLLLLHCYVPLSLPSSRWTWPAVPTQSGSCAGGRSRGWSAAWSSSSSTSSPGPPPSRWGCSARPGRWSTSVGCAW